jgi:hypothetical protein
MSQVMGYHLVVPVKSVNHNKIMKNILTGLTLTFLIALSVFVVTQFKGISLHAIENVVPKTNISPTIVPSPTNIPTAAPISFSGSQKTFIYLYPSKFIPMSIKLDSTIDPQNSLPRYPGNDWYVIATSKSLIENQYDYLSFNTEVNNLTLSNSGWIVSNADIKNWFDDNLPKFGLNQKEASQFKDYCLSQLKASNFYQISYLTPKDKLLVNPPVANTLRYSFYFTNLDSVAVIPTPTVVTPSRGETSVVELSAAFEN